MRVSLLSTFDLAGGAARAAYRLHAGLLRLGVESTMRVRHRKSGEVSVRGGPAGGEVVGRWHGAVELGYRARWKWQRRGLPAEIDYVSSPRSASSRALAEGLTGVDVVNLHWVADWLDWGSFFRHLPGGSSGGPALVWTLHDMNPLVGALHYQGTPLGVGPAVPGGWEGRSRAWLKRKVAALASVPADRLTVVSPSRWLAVEAEASPTLGRFPVEVIPYGLDVEAYRPRDRALAREALGVPESAPVVAFVSGALSSVRKGGAVLREAMDRLRARMPELVLLSAGWGDAWGPGHRHLGQLQDDRLLSLLYSAADVFVIPSQQDNLPNTVLEAMACGTPVVGFAVGGIPDMVRPGQTGRLAEYGDVEGMAEMLAGLLGDEAGRAEMGRRAREVAESEYPLALQAERYLELFKQSAQRWSAASR
ncbi:MAG: glycosyltransferase [Planctomycetota bacterium]